MDAKIETQRGQKLCQNMPNVNGPVPGHDGSFKDCQTLLFALAGS